jgi:hypothetical protein
MTILFDLDGTLADIQHRRHLVDKVARGDKGPDWPAFFKACALDRPILPVINIFNCLYNNGKHLEIWSGRSDEVMDETVRWLQLNVFIDIPSSSWMDPSHPKYVRLRMRRRGDYTPDATLKQSWLLTLKPGAVECVFDDRQRCVDMWRKNLVLCLQVAEGNY